MSKQARRRCKNHTSNGMTLICCAVVMVVSVNFFDFKEKEDENTPKNVQTQNVLLVKQTEELSSLENFNEILSIGKKEISLNGKIENEDSFNAQFEAELIEKGEVINDVMDNQSKQIDDEENSIIMYSNSDYELLCKITYAEAGNQTMEQQTAVAAIILNRVENDSFPNSIKDVIMQKGQFSSTKDGEIYAIGKMVDFSNVPEETKNAVSRAIEGEDPTEKWLENEAKKLGLDQEKYAEGGALYFYNPEFTSPKELTCRNTIKCKVRNGAHIFYKVWD